MSLDVLSDLLRVVRLSGAVFFRADFRAPWALSSPDSGQLAKLLLPSARRMVLFHCVLAGDCWVDVEGQPRERLHTGDVVVLPSGEGHAMGAGDATLTDCVTGLFPGPPPWSEPPHLEYGGCGETTRLVCGFLQLDDMTFNPLLSSLPPVLVARPDGSTTGRLLRSSVDFLALELDSDAPGAASVLARLTETVFVEVLRQHTAQLPSDEVGWLAALRDRGVARGLEAIHARPGHPWTVEELARRAAMSRSSFAARFSELLGRSPAQYLTRWRLQIAARRLRDSDDGIAVIAEEVGYGSEAALSRAFKRETGQAPAQYRRQSRPRAAVRA